MLFLFKTSLKTCQNTMFRFLGNKIAQFIDSDLSNLRRIHKYSQTCTAKVCSIFSFVSSEDGAISCQANSTFCYIWVMFLDPLKILNCSKIDIDRIPLNSSTFGVSIESINKIRIINPLFFIMTFP